MDMGLLKRFLLLVLLVVAVGAGITWGSKYLPPDWRQQPQLIAQQAQPWIAQHTAGVDVRDWGQTGLQLGGQLTSQVQSVTGKVLGVQTESTAGADAASQSTSLPVRTLEFARYSYCKEVVKEYESRPR